MPASHYPGHSHPYRESQIPTLSYAHSIGQFVEIKCTSCRRRHIYRPADLKEIVGDLHIFKLQNKFRCDGCNRKDCISVSFKSFLASEIVGMTVRELVEVKMVKKPIWRDVKL